MWWKKKDRHSGPTYGGSYMDHTVHTLYHTSTLSLYYWCMYYDMIAAVLRHVANSFTTARQTV